MIRFSALPLVLFAALAVPVSAQTCANLTANGPGHHGTMMNFSLTGGSPQAPAFMMLGLNQGHTRFDFGPMGSLALGLGGPLHLLPLGHTNGLGHVQMGLQVPHGLMHRMGMFGQGFTFVYHPGQHQPWHHPHHQQQYCQQPWFEFCTSNVCAFHVGGRR